MVVLGIILTIGLMAFVYQFLWNRTREKLNFEDEKYMYLEKKFSLHNFKEENIIKIFISMPYNRNKSWKVYKKVKKGTWPLNDREEDIEIFSISDYELEKLLNQDK